jgi:hypothetical protein
VALYKYYICVDPNIDAWYDSDASVGNDPVDVSYPSDNDPNIIIARKGYNADNPDLDHRNKAFSSEFNMFKIVKTIYFPNGSGQKKHGFHYAPTFNFLKLTPSEERGISDFFPGQIWQIGDGTSPTWTANVSIDDTYVYSDVEAYITLCADPLDE